MSSCSPPAETCGTLPPALLEWLRGQDNPFDVYVQARHADGTFRRGHVHDVNKDVFEKLQGAVERYQLCSRQPGQNTPLPDVPLEDVPRSGVVLIQGKRGAGKTHLVHALEAFGRGAVIVAPTYFEPDRPFPEYLLQQLVRKLQDDHDGRPRGTLRNLADWFARQVSVQALYGMTETDWLAHNAVRGVEFWLALWGWTHHYSKQKELLITRLETEGAASIVDVCRSAEQDATTMRQIALRQIAATETGLTIRSQIRRGLYAELVNLAFEGPAEPLFEFLLDGFTQVQSPSPPSRVTLVEELLRALIELFLLFGKPVVYAFDSLETLFGYPPEERVCLSFFQGTADLLDAQRGIPFILLAEHGHWELARRFLSSYAAQRFQQGIPTRGFGGVSDLLLPEITADELERIVAARLRPLLQGHYDGHVPADDAILPFERSDIAAVVRANEQSGNAPPLRQALQSLRERYEQVVFNRKPPTHLNGHAPPVPQHPPETTELAELWRRELRLAERKVEAEKPQVFLDRLLEGFKQWLASFAHEGTAVGGWKPGAPALKTFDNNAHGQLIQCVWEKGTERVEAGVAFLVGAGSTMPRDLQTKLTMMSAGERLVDDLTILWPRDLLVAGDAASHLPPKSKAVWDEALTGAMAKRVRLKVVGPKHLAQWLAVESWHRSVRDALPNLSAAVLQHFVSDQTQPLLELVAPRVESN